MILRTIREHLRCTGRAALIYGLAALAGVAVAAEAGAVAPAGLPDLGPYATPLAMVLGAYILRSGGPVITVRLVTVGNEKQGA